MYEHLKHSSVSGLQPWGRMFHEGHGDFWRSSTAYIESNQRDWESAVVH